MLTDFDITSSHEMMMDNINKKQDSLWCCLFPWALKIQHEKPVRTKWRTAKSNGRVYYYHSETRTAQWEKPDELKLLEKKILKEKREKDAAFFKEMESNILVSLKKGQLIPGILLADTKKEEASSQAIKTHRVRTLSCGLDDGLLTELKLRDDHNVMDVPSDQNRHRKINSLVEHTAVLGTYSGTLEEPDVKATTICVCACIRAHIADAAGSKSVVPVPVHPDSFVDIDVFLDEFDGIDMTKYRVPELKDVVAFYEEFFTKSKMEHDTILMTLIYVERLVKATNGRARPNPQNWKSLLFSCMILASKVWDDLSMWNIDFVRVSQSSKNLEREKANGNACLLAFSIKRINELELALLKCLNFDVKVSASEYAKYYFLVRNMLIRSGLVKESERPPREQDTFQKLETLTTKYQRTHCRTKSTIC